MHSDLSRDNLVQDLLIQLDFVRLDLDNFKNHNCYWRQSRFYGTLMS